MPLRKIGKTWYIDVYINGKRIQKRASANKAIAQRILNELLAKQDLARFGLAPDNCPLEMLKEKFLAEIQSRVLPKTFHNYCVLLEMILKFISDVQMQNLRDKINEFIIHRQAEGIAPRTINHAIEILKRMFNYGIESGYLSVNPVAGVRKLKIKNSNRRALTIDEIQKLLKVSGRYRAIWLCFLTTGLRRSELVNLKWDDIDFKRGVITVKASKTDTGIRIIPVTQPLICELQQLKQTAKTDYVFTTETGTPLRNNLLRAFKACLKEANIKAEGLNIHCLRYTFATLLLREGVSPVHVQKLLGHRSALTSLDIYAKVYAEDLKKAIDKISFG